MPRVSDKHQLNTQFLEMIARENEEQTQEKMLEQFEQSLEYLDEAGITSIEVLQSVIEEIQAIANDSDSSIKCNEESSPESDRPESSEGSESSGNDSEADGSEEDELEEDGDPAKDWRLKSASHGKLDAYTPISHNSSQFLAWAVGRVLGCLEGCLGALGCVRR